MKKKIAAVALVLTLAVAGIASAEAVAWAAEWDRA